MKISIRLILILALTSLLACDKDELGSLEDKGLNGKWNLISVSCECEPVNLEKGQLIWYIDTVQSKLIVVNHLTDDVNGMESGEYNITINQEDSRIEILSIDYEYWFEDSDLIIADKPWVDGPLIRLVRD
ncbi:hypothetical protein [uncultured Draconibacterium sp.]|uniref:hypothetical protein n=1 Tax=uncultured Draconibacterium sp. TaxID=1573823 RepID=UPI0025D737C8|nr:hypothetical protein [uncultured Draconibacterium sp.]